MSYKIKFLEEENILETIYHGTVKIVDLGIVFAKNLKLARKHHVHLFLVDCLELEDDKAMIVENYEAGILLKKIVGQLPKRMRNAIVLPRSLQAAENLLFFETMTRNRGLNVRSFENREAALTWLLEAEI